ncbi:MAG: alpha/beta hydrolase family protein [Caldimonas sp.]
MGAGARVLAEPLSIGDALSPDGIDSMHLSPDAKHVVAIMHAGRASGVVLSDTDTVAFRFIVEPMGLPQGPTSAFWINDHLLAINGGRGGYTLDIRDKKARSLGGIFLQKVKSDADGHERVLVSRQGDWEHVDRVDVRTGSRTVMNFDMPGDPVRWVVDRNGVPLVVTTIKDGRWFGDGSVTHWYRGSLDDKWEKLATFPFTKIEWFPAFVMADGKSIAVRSDVDRDTSALFRYNVADHRLEDMLAGHPTQDIEAVRHEGEGDDFEAAVTRGMLPELHWFEPRHAALQRAIDAALPNRLNRFSGVLGKAVLIYSYGDVDPGRWFLLDIASMTLKFVGASRPRVDPQAMSPTQIVSYRSTDGLVIPAYLTRPAGASAPGPAVLLIHGGPVARDTWAWNAEVQMLASRGYTVLQPQFRGSSGFGKRFREAGYGQWGLAMQDDVTAGARWLIEQGYAVVDRVCIYGGSYGGYAAMWALAKTPRTFRCGISFAGVSDLKHMMSGDSDLNERASGREALKQMIGDPNQQAFDEVSPLKKAAAIESPLLIAHGDRDARVPISQSEDMVDAMKKNGKTYVWLELRDEGHGIRLERNQQRFFETLFEFLQRNIGSGAAARASSAPR